MSFVSELSETTDCPAEQTSDSLCTLQHSDVTFHNDAGHAATHRTRELMLTARAATCQLTISEISRRQSVRSVVITLCNKCDNNNNNK